MTQTLAVTRGSLYIGLASRPEIQAGIERRGFSLKACSRVRGRERWQVGGLKGNKRLAAAVGVALRGEPGVEEATANPLTGRVLVRYLPNQMEAPVEILICRAIAFAPVIEREFSRPVTSERRALLLPKRLLKAELGCSLLKLLFFGGTSCPVVGIWCAAGAIVALSFAVQRSV